MSSTAKKFCWYYVITTGIAAAIFNANRAMNPQGRTHNDMVERLGAGAAGTIAGLVFGFIEIPLLLLLRDSDGNFEYLPIKFK